MRGGCSRRSYILCLEHACRSTPVAGGHGGYCNGDGPNGSMAMTVKLDCVVLPTAYTLQQGTGMQLPFRRSIIHTRIYMSAECLMVCTPFQFAATARTGPSRAAQTVLPGRRCTLSRLAAAVAGGGGGRLREAALLQRHHAYLRLPRSSAGMQAGMDLLSANQIKSWPVTSDAPADCRYLRVRQTGAHQLYCVRGRPRVSMRACAPGSSLLPRCMQPAPSPTCSAIRSGCSPCRPRRGRLLLLLSYRAPRGFRNCLPARRWEFIALPARSS
jgi:hypothetical protein